MAGPVKTGGMMGQAMVDMQHSRQARMAKMPMRRPQPTRITSAEAMRKIKVEKGK